MGLGVVILAGGRSSRMGADKAGLDWGGRRAIDWLAELAAALGARSIVTSGPRDYGLPVVPDREADGGPVAGLAASAHVLAALGCERALALGADAPTVKAGDLAPLLGAPSPGAAYAALNLPLVWDLAATPRDAAGGWSVHRFIEVAGLLRLPCPAEAEARLRGANTPEEREALLLAAFAGVAGARNRGAG